MNWMSLSQAKVRVWETGKFRFGRICIDKVLGVSTCMWWEGPMVTVVKTLGNDAAALEKCYSGWQ